MLWRAVTGVGSGASNVPVMGLLAAWFARERRGTASGVAVAGSSLALMFVGPLAPRLLARFGASGWRVCWFVFGGLTLALAAAAWALLRNRPAESGGEAAGTAAPAAGRLPWGLVYRSGAVWRLGLVYVAFGFSYIIYMTFFVRNLLNAGCSVSAAGQLFMLMGFCSLFCGLIWGGLSDRIGRKGALAAVYLVQAAAFALFALCPTRPGFALSAVLFGLTAWSIPAIMAAACGDLLGPRLSPAALGFITLFFGAGQALGPYAAGAMADMCGGFGPAFLLAAAVALAGSVGCAFLPAAPRRET
jgi:predicted MFS family arabinose efflux permease